jgi:UDP-2-acetamido-2,6-beta-L-arabino-hexul-4-ose reductase
MTIAVTGADGFLARHLRVRLRALTPDETVVSIGRDVLNDEDALDKALAGADSVVHLAGVNRGEDAIVEGGNVSAADHLVAGLLRVGSSPRLVFGNSRQVGKPTPYGRGKARATEILADWAERAGAPYVDVVFPNLYGEGGKPDYNSVVATFCYRLATGAGEPKIDIDRELDLLHAQDAAAVLMEHLGDSSAGKVVRPAGTPVAVSEILRRLEDLAATYRTGRFPDLGDPLTLRLFNTYRFYLHPEAFPMPLTAHHDRRGSFVETAQVLGGASQSSFSTTEPGVTRGNHFHLRKVERFVVVRGRARIDIRPVWGGRVASFEVAGDEPAIVDMPTLHTHSITNVGDESLYTVFWVNELFDPDDPDTFAEALT